MDHPRIYIAAYDIGSSARLVSGLRILREYATGWQKSVFECPLNRINLEELRDRMGDLIIPGEDRFTVFRLDPRRPVYTLGCALPPTTTNYFYVD